MASFTTGKRTTRFSVAQVLKIILKATIVCCETTRETHHIAIENYQPSLINTLEKGIAIIEEALTSHRRISAALTLLFLLISLVYCHDNEVTVLVS